jgi:hypothetical protein
MLFGLHMCVNSDSYKCQYGSAWQLSEVLV